jgi:hypothetical protein
MLFTVLRVESGERGVESGERGVESGEWRVECGGANLISCVSYNRKRSKALEE